MSRTISPQHPAVVLRSHYVHLRALLAVTLVAVVGLTAAVVVLATRDRSNTTIVTSAPRVSSATQTGDAGARLDHRGLHYRALSSDSGARLDHRGLHYRAPASGQ